MASITAMLHRDDTAPDSGEITQVRRRSRLPHGANKHTLRERPLLHALAGWNQGEVFAISDGEIVIGSGRSAGICLRDRNIAGNHARIECREDGVWIEDLGSADGTYVNGLAVRRAALRDGDKVRIGPTTVMRFGYYYDLDEGYMRRMQEAARRSSLKLGGGSDAPAAKPRTALAA
jgi:two-component system, cell cycle response regulator